VGKEIHNTIL